MTPPVTAHRSGGTTDYAGILTGTTRLVPWRHKQHIWFHVHLCSNFLGNELGEIIEFFFLLAIIGPRIYPASKRNKYHKQNFLWWIGSRMRPARKANNLTSICDTIVHTMWNSQYLTTLYRSTACHGDNFTSTLASNYWGLIIRWKLCGRVARAKNMSEFCKIWGFHGCEYEECRLIGCYTAWLL
jgi:hypothetical protein